MARQEDAYPVQFSVDYPDRDLDRFSSFFRIFAIVPVSIALGLVSAGATFLAAGGLLFGGPLVMILFRQKYPRWWFDWNVELLKFENRVGAYASLLRDEYPSTDEEQAVHLEIQYPDAEMDLNRWLPLVKWLLAIPHYIVLFFLGIGVLFAVIIAWFAILFTSLYHRGLHVFVVGVMRWTNRVSAYMFILTTDKYPPFQLKP
jgi:hypothetical protein